MDKTSAKNRQFTRFNLAHSPQFGGSISESPVRLRLASLSLGGCGFYGGAPSDDFYPPKEVICSIFESSSEQAFKESHLLVGNLIYLKPTNQGSGDAYYYGVKFHEQDRQKIQELISKMENLAKSGHLDRLA